MKTKLIGVVIFLLSTSVRAADPTACVAATNSNPLLAPPASAQDVHFLRCGTTDKVVFRVLRPFPGQSVSDLILNRWKDKGWLPILQANDSWNTEISKDRLRMRRFRTFTYENAKGGTALLILMYDAKFTEPIADLPSENLDLGDDLRVEASVSPSHP